MATILIVDDQEVDRALLALLLSHKGHKTLEASDGATALELVRTAQPDLVITDIVMPGMDGSELVRSIRADPEAVHTHVVFYTGQFLEHEARCLGERYGVSLIITKGSEPDAMMRTVEDALGQRPPDAPPSSACDVEGEHLSLFSRKLAERVEQLGDANAKLEALLDLGRRLSVESDPARLVETYCRAAWQIIGAKCALAGIFDSDGAGLRHFGASGLDEDRAARIRAGTGREGVIGEVVTEGVARRVTNPGGDPAALGLSPDFPTIRSLLCVPVRSPGRVCGWLCLVDKVGAERFSEQDEKMAEILAVQSGVAYDNVRQYGDARKAQQEFRALADNSPDAIVRFDRELRHRYLNPAAARLANLPADAVIGKTHRELGFSEDLARLVENVLGEVIRTRKPSESEFDVLAPVGNIILDARIAPELAADGSVESVLVVARDITQRKRTEEELRQSESRRRAILAALPDMMFELTSHGYLVDYHSARDAELLAPPEAFMGRHASEVLPAEVAARLVSAVDAAHRTGKVQEFEYELTVDGRVGYYEGRVVAVGSDHCLAIARDITERKRAEAALQESEERFRQLAENLQDVVYVVDKEVTRLLYINPAYEVVWGRSRESVYQDLHSFVDAVHPDDVRRVLRMLEDQTRGEFGAHEYRIIRSDGSMRWIRDRGFLIRDNDGNILRVAGIAEDVTEPRRAEEALRQSEELYRTLARNFPNGAVLLFDQDLRYTLAEGAGLADVGLSKEIMEGKTIWEVFPRETCDVIEPHFRAALAGESRVYEVPYADRLYRTRTVPVKNERGETVAGMVMTQDISEVKRTESALKQRNAQLAALHEIELEITGQPDSKRLLDTIVRRTSELLSADVCNVFICDSGQAELRVAASNSEAMAGLRLKPGEGLAGLAVATHQTIAVEDYARTEQRVATVPPDRYGPALASPLKWQEEVLGAISMGRRPGEPPFSDDEIRLAEQLASEVAIAIHQTQLFEQVRNASERLQLLSQRLLEIQESERRTLARELHDEIGQVLTAVKINLHALKRQPAASTLEAQLDESILITEQALEQVRNMSVDLRPSVLDDLGLVSALRWFLDRQSRRTGFAAEFRAIGVETRLPANLETVCFRVAQESLTNVTRHAQATRVILEVRQADGELQLLIRDDGIGFNVDAARRRAAEGSSFGLLGMEERVVLAGGEFEIASAPKEGTEVRARFKLNP